MANLKDLIVNGVSRFLGKVYINDSQITTINDVTVGDSPKFTDTTALGSMTGTLGLEHGGTGATSASAARTNLGLGSAATASTATSVGNNSNLPTGAAIQTYVTGLGYEANQNAFSNVTVGSTTIAADTKTDTLTLVAGSNVTLTPDATNDKVTIAATDTTYESKAAASGGTDVSLVTTGEKYTWNSKTSNTGTVTQITAGSGLSMGSTSGGSTTTTGTINHTNSVTAQNTQAIYPIKIDAQGHISGYGSAVTPLTSHQTIKQDGITGATATRYGVCSTAASTAAKTVNITSGTFNLGTGARVTVKFSNANTASSPTLNVNSKGAKNIFHRGSQITSGANKALLTGTVDFVYDGTQWNLIGNYYDTTYSNATGSAAGLMSATDKSNLDLLVNNIDGEVEIWEVTGTETSGNAVTITDHTSTPYEDVAACLSHNIMPILRFNSRLYYIVGTFSSADGDDDDTNTRYSFVHHESFRRRVINVRANETVTYTYPTGGTPQFHRSTDTTYGVGSANYYGHNKVINNLTTASYTEGESLSAYQGKVLKDAVDGKQASINGGASSITSSNLTASRALVSNGSGKVAVSAVTATELGYLDGVTSNVQTQLNGKLKSSGYTGNDVSRVMITDSQGVVMPYSDGITVTQLYALRNIDDTQTVQNQIDGKAPTNHQSTATTYGVGTALAYGHVKVANNLSTASFDADAPVVLSAYQGKVLKDGITAVTPTLPNISTTSGGGTISVPNATATNAGNFTLTKGLWIIVVTARWANNATGHRQLWLSTSSTGGAKDYASIVSIQAANGAVTSEQLTSFYSATANTTLYIVLQQNSNAARNCDVRYSLCRLGDA